MLKSTLKPAQIVSRLLKWAGLLIAVVALYGQPHTATAQRVAPAQQQFKQFGPRLSKTKPTGGQSASGTGSEVIGVHGDWKITCDTVTDPDKQSKRRACGMLQTGASTDEKKLALSFILLTLEKGSEKITMARIIVPVGVYLPTGVAIEIDGNAATRVPFERCLTQACIAVFSPEDAIIANMKRGASARFLVHLAPGSSASVALSLKGFTAAFEALQQL